MYLNPNFEPIFLQLDMNLKESMYVGAKLYKRASGERIWENHGKIRMFIFLSVKRIYCNSNSLSLLTKKMYCSKNVQVSDVIQPQYHVEVISSRSNIINESNWAVQKGFKKINLISLSEDILHGWLYAKCCGDHRALITQGHLLQEGTNSGRAQRKLTGSL